MRDQLGYLTLEHRESELLLALQALADTPRASAQLRSTSEDFELGRFGGVPPAERVFMYLQVQRYTPHLVA